ncbi:MAG: TatD family nuclease-associated radical SAM protein [Gammaproteobacteria bacterium]|nr:TatD family nuclease-associated radical SAM protein [Gammaproteobacteria bacterium]MCF6362201.1 TatD family nuclease-associated radical SAM protein [Gammaproteobacteria bacterium]
MPISIRRQRRHEEHLAYRLHGNCYLNITYHCTLRCAFCPKFNGSWEVQNIDLLLTREPQADEVLAAIGDSHNDHEIVFCGLGEPTLNLAVLLDVARALKVQDKRIRLNTDGLANLVHGRDVTPELAEVVDAVSISMNAQDEATYERHCRPKQAGAFLAMQDFARRAGEQGMAVTLTAIDGLDGVDIAACEQIASSLGAGFRRRVLDRVG